MFQYFYRIYDRYDKEIVTLAIMTSPYNSKFSTEFHYTYFGTELYYAYTHLKLIDYNHVRLEQSNKLFSKIVLAAKYKNETEKNAGKRSTFMEAIFARIQENAEKAGVEKGLEQVIIELLKKGFTTDLIEEVAHVERAKIERLREMF